MEEDSEIKIFKRVSELGLVNSVQNCCNLKCKKYGEIMQLKLRKRNKQATNNVLSWRCSSCGSYRSVFESSKCSLDLDKQNLKLGGLGKIIEIDESLYAKLKHGKGKDLKRPNVWVFGLVQRKDSSTNGSCYLQVVPNREAETLLSIIYDKCLPGSIIYSDCWSSYNKISQLQYYQHQTVNHSYNFIDPDSGACTNRIESLWNSSKYRFKDMKGCKRAYIQSYLDEFIWRFNNNLSTDRVGCYNLILKVIVKFYKPGTKQEDFEKKCSEVIGDINEDVKTHFVETEDDEEDLEQDEDTNSVTDSILGSLVSSKCDSDVANLKDLDDDNKEDDDHVNSNDINNFEEDTESIDEETDSNTLAKSDSLTQKSIHSDDSTVYDEEDEQLNQISENMNTLVIRSVKEKAVFYKD
ncbi:unnamed protein product [Brachionus calyciflorus]|uniref:ISXO2-like transposase domain-containing protein n=1 Tax=Brachionus calyciflorus TaxID=104777 RepID=A0A814N6C5_9BILA|nr:unnamed protein product [Brachionus calyciflorus]